MNKSYLILSLAGLSFACNAHSQVLFSENFESQTPGNQPTGTAVRPTSNSADLFAEVVTGAANGAGGGVGNGVQLFDNNNNSAFAFENNFVADAPSQVSAIRLSFDFAWEQDLATSNYARGGIGAYSPDTSAVLNQGTNLFLEFRFTGDGEFYASGSGSNNTGSLNLGQAYHLDIFVNDFDSQSIDYDVPGGGTASLAANTFAAYLDGSLFLEDGLENAALTGDANLGRMGVVSFGGFTGISHTYDNFEVVNVIPEPSTYAMLAGALILGASLIKRRRL